jgi:hypothetical protein
LIEIEIAKDNKNGIVVVNFINNWETHDKILKKLKWYDHIKLAKNRQWLLYSSWEYKKEALSSLESIRKNKETTIVLNGINTVECIQQTWDSLLTSGFNCIVKLENTLNIVQIPSWVKYNKVCTVKNSYKRSRSFNLIKPYTKQIESTINKNKHLWDLKLN